tara:strand:- start:8144 stop:8500 length:357 start_codon:yes stop_codon:yes gene_type:complete
MIDEMFDNMCMMGEGLMSDCDCSVCAGEEDSGDYVMSAAVVRYHGLKTLKDMEREAHFGFMSMQDYEEADDEDEEPKKKDKPKSKKKDEDESEEKVAPKEKPRNSFKSKVKSMMIKDY